MICQMEANLIFAIGLLMTPNCGFVDVLNMSSTTQSDLKMLTLVSEIVPAIQH